MFANSGLLLRKGADISQLKRVKYELLLVSSTKMPFIVDELDAWIKTWCISMLHVDLCRDNVCLPEL